MMKNIASTYENLKKIIEKDFENIYFMDNINLMDNIGFDLKS